MKFISLSVLLASLIFPSAPWLLATFPSHAMAAEWINSVSDDENESRAFDLSRTRLTSPGTVRTWKRYSLKGLDSKYPGYRFSITEWDIDCIDRRQRILSSFDYGTDGKIINTDLWKDSEFRPIPPESKGDSEATQICNRMLNRRK